MPVYDGYDEEAKRRKKNATLTTGNPAADAPMTETTAAAPKTVVSGSGAAVSGNSADMKHGGNGSAVTSLGAEGFGNKAREKSADAAGGAALAKDLDTPGGSISPAAGSVWTNKDENASFGVRDYLEQGLGIDGKRVGWDGENVTFDGNPLIKAERVSDEGRSYVQDQSAVDAAVGQYAQEHGMVAIRDYANSLGTPMNISWNGDNGTVEINGQVMKPDFISNGKAYVYKNKLDQVLEKADNGFRRSTDYLKDAYDKYGGGVDEAYNALMNYGDFSYDKDNDRAYQDFMDVYRRAVEDEYNANMAQARFRTGGLAAPSVMSQAAAVRSRALDDAAKYGQQYEDRAYDRWKDTRDFTGDKLSTAWDMMKGTYDLESGAEKADREAYNEQINNDWTRRLFEQQLKKGNIELDDAYSNSAVNRMGNDLYLRDAPYYADIEKGSTGLQFDNEKRANRIGNAYDESLAQENYSQSVAQTKGMELANLMSEKNLTWQDLLNLFDAANALHSMKTNAAANGVSADGYDPLLQLVMSRF